MEEYDREFLTFTVKDEPVDDDSEDDFIGFEDISSSYADIYKQYILVDGIKDEFQPKGAKPPEPPKASNKKAAPPKVYRPAIVKKKAKPAAPTIKMELHKGEPMNEEEHQDVTITKTLDVEMQQTDIEITVIGSFPDNGTKASSVYNCDICGAKYTRKSKLRTHILNHVVKGPNELPLCEYCGEWKNLKLD